LLCAFFTQASNTSNLKTLSNVAKITQDSQGFVWLAGQQGLTRIDDNNNITFSVENSTWPLPFSWIHDVSIANNKLLLATESHGTWLFDSQTGKSEQIPINIAKKSHYHAVFFLDNYYINAPNKFYRYNPNTKTTNVIHNDVSIKKIVHNHKQLYISDGSALYYLQGERLVELLDEPIKALTALPNAIIAVTPNKIYRIDQDNKITSITHDEKIYALCKEYNTDNFFTLSSKGYIGKYNANALNPLPHFYGSAQTIHARQIFHDNSGVLWLSSSQGIEQLSENDFIDHKKVFDIPINANEITLFDNNVIIGSYGAGLQNFTTPVFDENVNNSLTEKGLKIFDVLAVNNNLYLATLDGLWRYNKDSAQVVKEGLFEGKLILKLIHKNGLLYIATNDHGLYIYNLKQNKIIKHLNTDSGLNNPEVIDVLPLASNNLWLANRSKVSIYNTITENLTPLFTPNKSKIIDLIIVGNKVFASTLGDGILVFNLQGELLYQLEKGQNFTEMLEIKGEIWVAGRPGLYRFSPENYQISMIENTQQYFFVGSLLVKGNTLYASHYGGILTLELSKNSVFTPPVVISKTTISGQPYLLNETINITSDSDVVTLDLASLDYRPGLTKKFKYRVNNSDWQKTNNNQLTLTGLTSGQHYLEIMATNSLGQWSTSKAYTEINVSYPWYWTVQMRIVYFVFFIGLISFSFWLLYLRSKSINYIHYMLKNDIKNSGNTMQHLNRDLRLILNLLAENEIEASSKLIQNCINGLSEKIHSNTPDNLSGKSLAIAIPFLADFILEKYQVRVNYLIELQDKELNYALQADIYKIIFEAIISTLFKSETKEFNISLQKVKNKIWLTISDNCKGFNGFDSKVNLSMASYTIRQIVNKNNASLNVFNESERGSQLVISIPLMNIS
jgi:ligand-binding sensor domain-containing protein